MHDTMSGPGGRDTEKELQQARERIRQQRERIKKQENRIKRLRERQSTDGGQPVKVTGAEVPVFFLIGRSKSGTGWLMRLLNFHPEVLCWGEGHFFDREKRTLRLRKLGKPAALKAKPVVSSLYNALADSEWLRLWVERSVWGRKEDPEEHIKNLTRLSINYFMSRRLAKTKKKVVGDKTPLLKPHIAREISEIYPGARAIHIVRDGRDQVVSQMHHYWRFAVDRGGAIRISDEDAALRDAYQSDPEAFLASGRSIFTEERLRESARVWAEVVGSNSADGRALLGDDYIEVKYEDLSASPEDESKRLFGFLGVDTKDRVVRKCVSSASFEKLSGRERGKEDAGKDWRKYRKGVAGDWKNVFTERDKKIFKEEAGDLLVKLGYERNNDW